MQLLKLVSLISLFFSPSPLFLQFSPWNLTLPPLSSSALTGDSSSLIFQFMLTVECFFLIPLSTIAFFHKLWFLKLSPFIFFRELSLLKLSCIYDLVCFLSLLTRIWEATERDPYLFCSGILSSIHPAYKIHFGINRYIPRKFKFDSRLHQSVGSWPSTSYLITVNLYPRLPK